MLILNFLCAFFFCFFYFLGLLVQQAGRTLDRLAALWKPFLSPSRPPSNCHPLLHSTCTHPRPYYWSFSSLFYLCCTITICAGAGPMFGKLVKLSLSWFIAVSQYRTVASTSSFLAICLSPTRTAISLFVLYVWPCTGSLAY